ncbi:MAG: hypothetical protein J6S57_02790 [Alphaproteobacteria bacterium]|nr:hypothetical protein [Alphaproteobacteria bacterium]
MFNMYGSSKPIMIMPAGEYLLREPDGTYHLLTPDATFENYAPMLYGNNLNHNFMTVIAVNHNIGTSGADTISSYGNGIGATYGRLSLSVWQDSENNIYQSRKCGMAGVGSGSIDPWCFAAAGPTAEMATASAAGAVASLKAAFDYMTNSQIFTLLALTADGPYLGAYTDPKTTSVTIFTPQTLAEYLNSMYEIPGEYDVESLLLAEEYEAYLNLFKEVYGYGLINLERAIRPGRSVYYYSDGKIISSSGKIAYWRAGSLPRASSVLSFSGHEPITTSFYDVVQSLDGSVSLPRVWNDTVALDTSSKHGIYMGDLLGEFDVGTRNKQSQKIGNFEFNMSMSPRAYSDNMNGLDCLQVAFVNDDFDVVAGYQRHLTDDESRFDGRANGLLALTSNAVSSKTAYKIGNLSFGVRTFNGVITDESLLENDPVVSSQYEPGHLGFADGGAFDTNYKNNRFAFDLSIGVMHEKDTVLGMYSDGLLYMNGAKTQYVDAVATYNVSENVRLLARGTFARTDVDEFGGLISSVSDIKSNAFAFGMDIGGFGLTIAAPLAVVDGNMGYGYAEYEVVENDNSYEIAVNNAHTEYVDLSAKNRELRFTTSYRKSFGEMVDAGVEFMYRLNPNNTNVFGNESVFILKFQRRIGI